MGFHFAKTHGRSFWENLKWCVTAYPAPSPHHRPRASARRRLCAFQRHVAHIQFRVIQLLQESAGVHRTHRVTAIYCDMPTCCIRIYTRTSRSPIKFSLASSALSLRARQGLTRIAFFVWYSNTLYKGTRSPWRCLLTEKHKRTPSYCDRLLSTFPIP